MHIVEVDPAADARWDAYVGAHPSGLVFQHSRWLEVLRRESGRPAFGLAAVDGDARVHGVLPLVLTRGVPVLGRLSAVLGPRLSSLPRTAVAGPLGDDDEVVAALVAEAVRRTPAGAQLQLKPPGKLTGSAAPLVAGRAWRTSYVLELPDRVEDLPYLRGRASRGLRSRLSKARRAGVVARDAASFDEVRRWYGIYLATMRDNAIPPRSLRLFEAMWRELRPRGLMRAVIAEHQGALVAGAVLLQLGATAFYAFGATDRSALALSPADVVQARLIEDACAAGMRRYDLGEVPEGNEGLAAFKRKWGARPVVLHRYYHPASAAPSRSGYGDRSAALALAERAWSRVPLGMTATAGAVTYRFL